MDKWQIIFFFIKLRTFVLNAKIEFRHHNIIMYSIKNRYSNY